MYFRLLHLGQKHIIGIINKETEHRFYAEIVTDITTWNSKLKDA
jgi:hypothetical protein